MMVKTLASGLVGVMVLASTALVPTGADAPSVDFVLNDGAADYECTSMNKTYAGCSLYEVVVNSGEAYGVLFYEGTYGSACIKICHSDLWFSYSQEMYWQGSGTTAYNANCNGGLFTVTISTGYLKGEPAVSPNAR